ncbi:hypothetical protein FRB90_005017 [Tulasnella sp. 427]|nr:hypothetical protein FRB90_005017 [Tulasnella sp. 427]
MNLKRKSNGRVPAMRHPSKKPKLSPQESETDQEISDDGVTMDDLARDNSEESTSSEGSEDSEDTDGESDEEEAQDGEGDQIANHGPRAQRSENPTSHQKSTSFRAPTTQEIRMIKEATDLFRSNSFKLQLDALLPTVTPRSSHLPPLEKCLFELHSVLSKLSAIPSNLPLNAAASLATHGVSVSWPSPPPTAEAKFKVGFDRPTDIKVTGSWANKISVIAKDGDGFNVDLTLTMPPTLFNEKDYLNTRFFHKRAYYLAVVAAAVAQSKTLALNVSYDCPQGDLRRTYLVLKPKPTGSDTDFTKSKASIRIHVSLDPSTSPISLSRLSPSHSNLRVTSSETNQPTPIYNNTFLQTFTPSAHLLSIHSFKTQIESFPQALTLLRVWANQRGYSAKGKRVVHGFEIVGGEWWSFLLAYLVFGDNGKARGNRKPLGRGLSSYQLFRGALDFLGDFALLSDELEAAHHDFDSQPVLMKATGEQQFPSAEYASHHAATFIDPTTTYNFFSGVPLESIKMLQHDAKITLDNLNQNEEAFESTFMKDLRDLPSRFDTFLRVNIESAKPRTESPWDILEHGSRTNALLHSLSSTVSRALGTRVEQSAILHPASSTFPLNQDAPTTLTSIDIGLILNPSEAPRLVDHGPDASEESACAEFRAFWGAKAELRRFKDGAIQESVVWDVKNQEERMNIPLMVVQYVLEYQFGISKEDVQVVQPDFDCLVVPPPALSDTFPVVGAKNGTRETLAAFDEIVKAVKAIDENDVPLSLSHVAPVSSILRQTAVFPPLPHDPGLPNCASHLPAIDVILQYEHSPKWPEDLAAIQKLKLAFLETIARKLRRTGAATDAAVALDDDASVVQDNCSLELVTPSSFAIRARIYCELEEILLKRLVAPMGKNWTIPEGYSISKDEAKKALEMHRRRFVHGPQHHNAVAATQHRTPSYGVTTRLVKRWLAAHFLLPFVPEEMVELLCAYVYLCPGAFGVPATGQTGFARVVRLLKEWDYRESPICVPVYTAAGSDPGKAVIFPPDQKAKVDALFKEKLGGAGWVIATEKDPAGSAFGPVLGPRASIPARIRQLAAVTWQYMCSGTDSGNLIIKDLFIHPLDDYDFLIHLKPSAHSSYYQSVQFDMNAWSNGEDGEVSMAQLSELAAPRVEFDPVRMLVDDLRRIYSDTALFFVDPCGGTVIAGLWNPHVKEERTFRALGGYSSMPVGSQGSKVGGQLSEA